MNISSPNILVIEKYKNLKTHIKVKCKKCNYIWESSPNTLLKNKNMCPSCNKKIRYTQEKYKNEFYKINTNSDIVNLEMNNNYVNMKGNIRVQCNIDHHIWSVGASYALKHNVQCPLCRNFETVTGINDLATLHPNLVKYFKYTERAKIVNHGGRVPEEMICPYCGNEKKIPPRQLVVCGFGCQECSDGISYPNKFCRAFLKQLPINNLVFEYNPAWIRPKKFDNYFEYNGDKYILEADGGFHFQLNTHTNESFIDAQLKDIEKENIAKKHGINVIRIDCRKSNLNYISNNISKSILAELFDLSKIDWNKCDLQATNSLVYDVCTDYKNKNCTLDKETTFIRELADFYGVHYETIRRYLKRGTELGLCNYDSNTYVKRSSKKVSLYDKQNNFIDTFLSPTHCVRYLSKMYSNDSFTISGICTACKRKNHKYKDFIVKYTEDIAS